MVDRRDLANSKHGFLSIERVDAIDAVDVTLTARLHGIDSLRAGFTRAHYLEVGLTSSFVYSRRTFDVAYRHEPKWAAASDLDQQLAERYAAALESRDLDAFTSLLRPDARVHMPPWRAWVMRPQRDSRVPRHGMAALRRIPRARDPGQRTQRDRSLRMHG